MLRKRIALLRRRADLSLLDFDEHWAGPHAPLIKRLPGLRRYVQNHVTAGAEWREEDAIDGIVEVWFDDDAVASPNAHFSMEQADDELRFLSGLTAFVVDDTSDYDPPAKVWAIARERSSGAGARSAGRLRAAVTASEVRVNSRLAAFPSMRRPDLSFDEPVPDLLLTACFNTVEDAVSAYNQILSIVSANDSELIDVRVVATSTLRFV